MTLFQAAPLLQASLALGVLALVVIQGGLSRSSTRWFALFIVGQMLWGLAVYGLRGSSDLAWALRWERLTPAAVSLTAVSFYRFSRAVVQAPVPRWMIIFTSAHFLLSLASIPTSFIVYGVEVASYGNTAIWGTALIQWTVPIYFMMVVSLATLYKGFRLAPNYTERNRLLLTVIGASMSVLGGLLDVAPVLGIDVPPATSWTNSLFFILVGVAILRYHLLDIQVTLQRRIAYLVRSIAILLAAGLGAVSVWLLGFSLWSAVPVGLGFVLAAEPAWRKLDSLLRSHLERDLLGELQPLLTLETGHGIITDRQIADTVLKLVQEIIHPSHCAFLVLQDMLMTPIVSQGYAAGLEAQLATGHPLAFWLRGQRGPAFHQDLIAEPWYGSLAPFTLEPIASLDAEVYVPMVARGSLEGILVLGNKAGHAIYSWQEMALLAALGQQAALLLESLRLTEADRSQRERMERLREVQRYMVEAREEERRSLAKDIHDEPIQMLVASLVRLNLILDAAITRPDLVHQQLQNVARTVGRAEQSLRSIMRGVFPSLLQDLGLLAALEALCQDLGGSTLARTPVHLKMTVDGVPHLWNPPLTVGLVIYRFVQEGLRNTLAHAEATEVQATVVYGPDEVTMEVVDNGRGVDAERTTRRRQEGHIGLLGLEERLGALGGNVTINNRAEGGVQLWGEFPHHAPTPDPQAQWSFEYQFVPFHDPSAPVEVPARPIAKDA
ncbi:MAG: GAF domain-containing protein [Chloroflexi bacterium]|nr:GAF domain-containing protein [Chloroflexota bacterium]